MENEGRVIPVRPVPYNLSRQAAEELICPFGATPMRPCNGSCHRDRRGADSMPAQSCSLVKATPGFA